MYKFKRFFLACAACFIILSKLTASSVFAVRFEAGGGLYFQAPEDNNEKLELAVFMGQFFQDAKHRNKDFYLKELTPQRFIDFFQIFYRKEKNEITCDEENRLRIMEKRVIEILLDLRTFCDNFGFTNLIFTNLSFENLRSAVEFDTKNMSCELASSFLNFLVNLNYMGENFERGEMDFPFSAIMLPFIEPKDLCDMKILKTDAQK